MELFYVWLPILLVACLTDGYKVQMKHLSTVYLPHTFHWFIPQFEFQFDVLEKAVLDPVGKIVYAIGRLEGLGVIHIIDASNHSSLTYLDFVRVPNNLPPFYSNMRLTDVTVCGAAIFVTYIDKRDLLHGGVLQYQVYSASSGTIIFTRDIKIGTQPDMLKATKHCTLVVALENPAVSVGRGSLIDPPGGVGIIRFPEGVANSPHKTTLDFTAFDHRFNGLAQAGVRWVYRGSNNKFSDDVEPEYVTFNAEQTKAYIGLQDNNAIAVVDLAADNITSVLGLGFKNWTLFQLDPSDRDNGIHMAPWPVYGIYQPDGIAWFRWSGTDYLVTANEGGAKEYDSVSFEEDKRGKEFSAQELSSSVSADMRAALRNDSQLGRLKFSSVDGKDTQGKYQQFYTFGGRSFSIRRASDMALIFDSGSELSQKTIELRKDLFNNDVGSRNTKIADGMDKRSDNRGPEPESVAVAESQGYLLIFVGIERPGSIAIYTVAPGDRRMQPRFQSLYTDGIPQDNSSTWGQLYDARRLHAMDPEYIEYVGTDKGLADYPMLLVAGTGSGTVSFLKIEITDVPAGAAVTLAGSVLATLATFVLVTQILQ
ncbi:uncharacterized protein [Littorina saxatilis]|uniref:uncharacterized protein isoform X1 n=1 Tax=Littorina saxatilis TaxID=31220 RepID=UPI0038B65CAD